MINRTPRKAKDSQLRVKKVVFLLLLALAVGAVVGVYFFNSVQNQTVLQNNKRVVKKINKQKEVHENNKEESKKVDKLSFISKFPTNWALTINKGYISKNLYIDDFIKDEFTIEFWITIKKKSKTNIPIITLKHNSIITTEVFLTAYYNKVGFYSFSRKSNNINDNVLIYKRKGLKTSPTESYHIAVMRKGAQSYIFINGNRVAKHIFNSDKTLEANIVTIVDRLDNLYKGGILLDEIRISKKALYKKNFTPSRSLKFDSKTTVFYAPCEKTAEIRLFGFDYWTSKQLKAVQLENISWAYIKPMIRRTNKVLKKRKAYK